MFIDAIIKDHKDAIGLLESLTESDKPTRKKNKRGLKPSTTSVLNSPTRSRGL